MELVKASPTQDSGTRGDLRREAMQRPSHSYRAGPAGMTTCGAFDPGSLRGDNALLVPP